jgi:hypothetical protein
MGKVGRFLVVPTCVLKRSREGTLADRVFQARQVELVVDFGRFCHARTVSLCENIGCPDDSIAALNTPVKRPPLCLKILAVWSGVMGE